MITLVTNATLWIELLQVNEVAGLLDFLIGQNQYIH